MCWLQGSDFVYFVLALCWDGFVGVGLLCCLRKGWLSREDSLLSVLGFSLCRLKGFSPLQLSGSLCRRDVG